MAFLVSVCVCMHTYVYETEKSSLVALSLTKTSENCNYNPVVHIIYIIYQGWNHIFKSYGGCLIFLSNRKSSHDKKSQDFGNLFSFPSYSQKSEDGMLIQSFHWLLIVLLLWTFLWVEYFFLHFPHRNIAFPEMSTN